jgi:hypothetical protein
MGKVLAVALAALILAGTAGAATIGDLQGLGYAVSISNPGPNPDGSCPTYFISGHGVQTYASACDPGFQAQVDSLANPVAICNADWQTNHPDQLQAFQNITRKGWVVSGDQCADVYNVTNPNNNTTAYSGSGSGLPGFDAQNGVPPAAQGTSAPITGGTAPTGSCLPLCPNPGDQRDGGVVIPATQAAPAQTITASSVVAPVTDPTVAAAAAAILFPDRSAGFLDRAGYGSGGALTP